MGSWVLNYEGSRKTTSIVALFGDFDLSMYQFGSEFCRGGINTYFNLSISYWKNSGRPISEGS